MGLVERVDGYQRRRPWVGFPLAVVYKFFDDQGGYLTALITYYAFVSLFPMLLLLVTVLGFALEGNPELQRRVVESALVQFPIVGDQLQNNVRSFKGNTFALVTGILGSLYGGLGVIQATQNALNKLWGVPRNDRPNPVLSRLRSLVLLVAGGGAVIALAVVSAVGSRLFGGWGWITQLGVMAVNAALFVVAFRVLTARPLSVAQVRAGAIAAAVVWQGVQWGGSFFLGLMTRNATATYGLFGMVLGLLAWIYLGALTFVMCAEVNVVRDRGLWPRSLMTPFTDSVELTKGDRRAYRSYARTERHKGFERVDVDFERPGPAAE
ncbi:YihY/virulence factor BrkB family protein [Actinomadura kijaniata]|uniref:YihY/virulence factor BrkB family protein n=1 Tax=Actinomadura kijaniata TaxID=46161 RepID=UPI000A988438|nr:YihY/virulence factor BrkB family protein [Actinomadura kijaniata]